MARMSACAPGWTTSRRLWADMRTRFFAALVCLLGFALEPIPEFLGQFLARAAVVTGQDQLARLQEPGLLLCLQRLERPHHHRVGVRIPPGVDPVSDLFFDLVASGHGHRKPSSLPA